MRRVAVGVLALSVLLNLVLVAMLGYVLLNGCAETDGRLGVLTRDVVVGRFQGTETLFVLPRGLVVRDASATGADWFEPHRFRLVVTSDKPDLVQFGAVPEPERDGVSEYYSADVESGPAAASPTDGVAR